MQDAVSRRDAARDRRSRGRRPCSGARRCCALGLVRPLVDRPTLKVVAKANVGRYARVPSFIELYGNGTALVLGNADLVPEHGTNADVGDLDRSRGRAARRRSAGRRCSARWVDDLIQWQYSSWGQARADNLGARAHPGRRAGAAADVRALGPAGRAGDGPGRARSTATTRRRTASSSPFHPRYRGYLRPELVRIALPAGLALGAYADAELRVHDYADPAQPGGSAGAPARRLRRHARVAARRGCA